MRDTSFGKMEQILKIGGNVVAEYLEFEREGRNHQHAEYESFTVLSGEGQVISGEDSFDVGPGDLVTIPPYTLHRMIPKNGQKMTGLLWYHDEQGRRLG